MFHEVGERIKELRTSKGLSQERASILINKKYNTEFTKGMFSKWENNKSAPTSENIRILAAFFNCDLAYIMGFDIEQESSDVDISELEEYFSKKENRKKLSSLNKEDSQKLIKLIDLYLD